METKAEKALNATSKEHQTAIVTGASRGIGLGMTQALLCGLWT